MDSRDRTWVVLVWKSMKQCLTPCVFLEVDSAYNGCVRLRVSLSLSLSISLSSHQVVFFEVELQDGVFDSCKHEADILRVGGACEMGVDNLVTVWVQVHKHLQDELATRLGIPLGTWEKNRPLFLASTEHSY